MTVQKEGRLTTDHGYRRPRSGRGGISQIYHRASQVVTQRNPCDTSNKEFIRINTHIFRICTWNVKTMYEAGKVQNAIQEMNRLSITALGISEMRWTGSGQCTVGNHVVYYSGNDGDEHQHGVGIIMSKSMSKYVVNFVPLSERIVMIQMNTTPVKLNIIQVYAPTADKPEEIIEDFYNDVDGILRELDKQDITIVMGDFNAKIGKRCSSDLVGPYGLGDRNDRGDRLSVFAQEYQLAIMNTFFKLPPRRLYTWKSPMDTPNHVIRNQIDYILINRRFRNCITSTKTYPSADIGSDHNPLVAEVRLKLKRVNKRTLNTKTEIRKIKDANIKLQIEQKLTGQLHSSQVMGDIDKEVGALTNLLHETSKSLLRPDTDNKRKVWMTNEIMAMMETRRQLKTKNQEAYRLLNRDIKRAIRTAKTEWIREQCSEIESLEKKHDNFNLHHKVRETAGLYKPKTAGCLIDINGKLLVDKETRLKTWKQYIEELFEDNRIDTPVINNVDSGPPITDAEVSAAIHKMKDGKTPGPDNIHAELLKLLDQEAVGWLTKVFNNIYNTGKIPTEWLKSTFVAIPKKPRAKRCSDYRTISLMSHLLKVFLKIIHQRLFRLCEEQLGRSQFGFRDALGTRDALFATQVLFQRCRDVNCDVHVCLIDYQKAFDTVNHEKLIGILRSIGLDDKDLRIIINLYWNQTANIKIEGELSDSVEIKRGVRQGCILSPLLFNIYSERIFSEALDESREGIMVNGERLNNFRYADDTIVFADSLQNLQALVTNIAEVSQRYGLDLNVKKTKYMVISKNRAPPGQLMVNQQQVEQVRSYTYLGSNINEQWDHSVEIRCRIEKARSTFAKMQTLFKTSDLDLGTKVRLLRCYVFSVLLYGVESWTLTEASTKKLQAFEMWLYRRILKIPWIDHVTNEEVLRRMNKQAEIIVTIKQRKLEYLGHIMRNEKRYGLLQLVLQGKIPSKRGPGRRRISWLKNLRTWFSTTTTGLFRAAVNKVQIAMMIANIRNG